MSRYFIVLLLFLCLCSFSPARSVSAQSGCVTVDISDSGSVLWFSRDDGGFTSDFFGYYLIQVSGEADGISFHTSTPGDGVYSLAGVLTTSEFVPTTHHDYKISNDVGGAASFMYCSSLATVTPTFSPTPTSEVLVTPTPIPTPTVDNAAVLVERAGQSFQLNIFLGAALLGVVTYALMVRK